MNKGISIDDLLKRKEKTDDKANGNGNGLSINDIREYDREQTILDRLKNKDKASWQDIYMMRMLDDKNKGNNVDIEEIIRKSQEPLLKEIEEMKRENARKAEEAKWDKMQSQLDKMQEMIIAGGKKNEEDPYMKELMKQFTDLQGELKDEKEANRKRDEENFKASITDMIDGITDQISMLKTDESQKPRDRISQIIELEKEKKELLNALGVKSNDKEDEASTLDVIDGLVDKVPKWAKTASTVREVFSKNDEIPDDISDEVPTTLPQRQSEVRHESPVPEDIAAFLRKGRNSSKGFIDYTGTQWINVAGEPLSQKDIEDAALTNPEDIRRLIKETDQAFLKSQKEKEEKKNKEAKNDEVQINHVHTPEKKEETKEPEPEEEEKDDIPETKPEEKKNSKDEAMAYISTGEEKKDADGNTVWVGKKNEMYLSDDGKPATKEDLIAMATDDPDGFMKTVKEHMDSIGEENGN